MRREAEAQAKRVREEAERLRTEAERIRADAEADARRRLDEVQTALGLSSSTMGS